TARLEVRDPLGHRHPDGPRREVDDRRVADLVDDRLLDRNEVLDLVARAAIGSARVDVDVDPALVHDPARLRRVLLGRVGDRGALVAVGDRSRDRAGDHDRVRDAHLTEARSVASIWSQADLSLAAALGVYWQLSSY